MLANSASFIRKASTEKSRARLDKPDPLCKGGSGASETRSDWDKTSRPGFGRDPAPGSALRP
ncbi:MAG: hypothetical protein Tsb0024_02580 [Ruegeria sp.]